MIDLTPVGDGHRFEPFDWKLGVLGLVTTAITWIHSDEESEIGNVRDSVFLVLGLGGQRCELSGFVL